MEVIQVKGADLWKILISVLQIFTLHLVVEYRPSAYGAAQSQLPGLRILVQMKALEGCWAIRSSHFHAGRTAGDLAAYSGLGCCVGKEEVPMKSSSLFREAFQNVVTLK